MKRGFTIVEIICAMLLMTCVSVVLLSLSDTITNSLKFSKDVVLGSVQQKQFNIALSQLTTKTKFAVCIVDKCGNSDFPAFVNNTVPGEPGFTAAVIATNKRQLELQNNSSLAPQYICLGFPGWLFADIHSYTTRTTDTARFYLFAKRPSLNATNLSSECLGVLVLDSIQENGITYARVSLFAGNGISTALERRIASYQVPLKDNVPGNYLIQNILYWPRLHGYSITLPSFSDSFSALNTSQLNLQRFGIFSPNILFLP